MAIDDFLGRWVLDPASSRYTYGDPPREATLDFSREGETLLVRIDWVDAKGQRQTVSYAAVPDGRPTATGVPGADTFALELVNDRRLDSWASRDGEVVARATRTLSPDGRRMTVVQTAIVALGALDDLSVYDRSEPARA
jgi:hypothetical protein